MAETDYTSTLKETFKDALGSVPDERAREMLVFYAGEWDSVSSKERIGGLEKNELTQTVKVIHESLSDLKNTAFKGDEKFIGAMRALEKTATSFIENKLNPEIGATKTRLENAQRYHKALEDQVVGLSIVDKKANPEITYSKEYERQIKQRVSGLSQDQLKEQVEAAMTSVGLFKSRLADIGKPAENSLEAQVVELKEMARELANPQPAAEKAKGISEDDQVQLEYTLKQWNSITNYSDGRKILEYELSREDQELLNTDRTGYLDQLVAKTNQQITKLLEGDASWESLDADLKDGLLNLQQQAQALANNFDPMLRERWVQVSTQERLNKHKQEQLNKADLPDFKREQLEQEYEAGVRWERAVRSEYDTRKAQKNQAEQLSENIKKLVDKDKNQQAKEQEDPLGQATPKPEAVAPANNEGNASSDSNPENDQQVAIDVPTQKVEQELDPSIEHAREKRALEERLIANNMSLNEVMEAVQDVDPDALETKGAAHIAGEKTAANQQGKITQTRERMTLAEIVTKKAMVEKSTAPQVGGLPTPAELLAALGDKGMATLKGIARGGNPTDMGQTAPTDLVVTQVPDTKPLIPAQEVPLMQSYT